MNGAKKNVAESPHSSPLVETFLYFLRLGATGFGGPLVLINQMRTELVENRQWINSEKFARAFALIKAMPGPVAFQSAVFLGRERAGFWGALAAGLGLNLPPFVLMVLFGVFYTRLRQFQASEGFLIGMQAAALGVILTSLKGLSGNYRRRKIFWIVAVLIFVLTWLRPAFEPLYIVGCGALLATAKIRGRLWAGGFLGLTAVTLASIEPPSLAKLAWVCFKSGAFVFGSGLAIVPLMEHDFVRNLGWLTHGEFMDALAFGQITPGPVVITATFIGYKSLGFIGAVVGTIAINLAPFLHMVTWFPRFIDRLAKLSWIPEFSLGAIAAVVGAIAATTLRLALTLDRPEWTLPLVLVSAGIALYGKLPTWFLIPAGGVIVGLLSLAV